MIENPCSSENDFMKGILWKSVLAEMTVTRF